MLAAVLNTLPPALCVAGVGMLALALVPRWAVLIGYGWVGWSLLMALFGSLTGINHWVLDTSVLHQMTLAPARRPDWTSAVALIAVAVGAAGIGLAIFCRRDLVDE
jgi:ABC-2 type transport system permease protein